MNTNNPPGDSSGAQLKSLADQVASSHELLKNLADKGGSKDLWDKMPAITSIVSSVLLAAVGMYVTHVYRVRDEEDEKKQAAAEARYREERDRQQAALDQRAAEMAERALVVQLMPFLTGENDEAKKGALLLLNGLGNTQLMAQLAVLVDTQGSRDALLKVATAPETNEEDKAVAKKALGSLNSASLAWFLSSFAVEMDEVFGKTVFPKELVAAIACHETGDIWASNVARGMEKEAMLAICAGDTLDAPYRMSWPKNRAELLQAPRGAEMFALARGALETVAKAVPSYLSVARNPDKFCRAFGPFAYDLQFYEADSQFFLESGWLDFRQCATRLLRELRAALSRQKWSDKKLLSDAELVHVAIAYIRGQSDLSKGFKQGPRDENGRYYGEGIHEMLQVARQIPKQAP